MNLPPSKETFNSVNLESDIEDLKNIKDTKRLVHSKSSRTTIAQRLIEESDLKYKFKYIAQYDSADLFTSVGIFASVSCLTAIDPTMSYEAQNLISGCTFAAAYVMALATRFKGLPNL